MLQVKKEPTKRNKERERRAATIQEYQDLIYATRRTLDTALLVTEDDLRELIHLNSKP